MMCRRGLIRSAGILTQKALTPLGKPHVPYLFLITYYLSPITFEG